MSLNLKKYKKYNSKDLKEQIIKHIVALKELSILSGNIFVSTKEERIKENKRKFFHILGGMILPFAMIYIPQKICIILNIIVLIPLLIADYNNWLLLFNKIPKGNIITQLLREHEIIKGKLNGLSWMLIGTLCIITLFDKYLASLSMAIFIISDAVAALIGKNFGRIKICCNKTLEGTISFILSSFIVYLIFTNFIFPKKVNFNILFISLSIFTSSIVELFSKNINIDDNFSLPLSFCLTYTICISLI